MSHHKEMDIVSCKLQLVQYTFVALVFMTIAIAAPVDEITTANVPVTTVSTSVDNIDSSIASSSIIKATRLLEALNVEVNKVLTESIVTPSATESIEIATAPVVDTVGRYAAETLDDHREQKFSIVLRELEDLEEYVQYSIRNLTASRQFAYGAMLRPMVTHIQQLRTNLTLLRNRMVGIVALNSITQQVNSLSTEIGGAITSIESPRDPALMNTNSVQDEENELKQLQDSLGWVTE